MWTKISITVLIVVFTTASSKDGIDGHDYHDDSEYHDYPHDYPDIGDILNECSNSTGYPIEKVYEKMDRKSSFCDEELAKDWMTCFYMKAGGMNDNHALNETVFTEEFSNDEENLRIVKNCINDAKAKDDKERACALDECLQRNNLIDEDDFGDYDHDHEHDHNHVHIHHHYHHHGDEHEYGHEFESEDDGSHVHDDDDGEGSHEDLGDDYEDKEYEGSEPSK